jgi:small subunit ribosomal protein S8
MKKSGYIYDYKVDEDNKQNIITILLKYSNGIPAIHSLNRISKPGLRVYASSDQVPRVLNGLGTAVISTSKGLLTDKEARKQTTGGEVICFIW